MRQRAKAAVECERCHQHKECTFYGLASLPEKQMSQAGEWLCNECVPLRTKELNTAIGNLKKALED